MGPGSGVADAGDRDRMCVSPQHVAGPRVGIEKDPESSSVQEAELRVRAVTGKAAAGHSAPGVLSPSALPGPLRGPGQRPLFSEPRSPFPR